VHVQGAEEVKRVQAEGGRPHLHGGHLLPGGQLRRQAGARAQAVGPLRGRVLQRVARSGRAVQELGADGGRFVQRDRRRLLHLAVRRQGVPVLREGEAGGDVEGRVRHRRLLAVQEGPEQHDDGVQQEDPGGSPRQPELVARRFRQVLPRRIQPVTGQGGEEILQRARDAVPEQALCQGAAEEAVQEPELIGQLVGTFPVLGIF